MLVADADLSRAGVEGLIVCLLLVCLGAALVFFGCRAAGRPDWGSAGAALILIVGTILCLL